MTFYKAFGCFVFPRYLGYFFLSVAALLLLLGGNYIGGLFLPIISLAFPVLFFVIYFSVHKLASKKEVYSIFALIFVYMFLLSSVLVDHYNDYGAYKISALVFSFFIPVLLFFVSIDRVLFLRFFSYGSLFFLVSYGIFSLVVKLLHGDILDRTLMGLNGPIVFSRLMILGLITALFVLGGCWRLLLVMFFLFMALISYSKGPLIGLFFVVMLFVRMKYSLTISFAFLLVAVIFEDIFQRYFNFFIDLFSAIYNGDLSLVSSGGNEGSVGERLESFHMFYNVSFDYFLGSGMGLWSTVFGSSHAYPHNLIIELIAEFGVFFNLFLFSFLLFGLIEIYKGPWRKNLFFALSVFFFIASLFSGSVVDARYFFFFFVVAVVFSNNCPSVFNKGVA